MMVSFAIPGYGAYLGASMAVFSFAVGYIESKMGGAPVSKEELEADLDKVKDELEKYITTAEITDIKTVLEKTQDILIEMFSLNQSLRDFVRDSTFKTGYIKTAKGKKALPASKFERTSTSRPRSWVGWCPGRTPGN